MTFIEFKKALLDADLTIPKFSRLIKINEKNMQSYKKKNELPNAIAAVVTCFAQMNKRNIDYKEYINSLNLEIKTKNGAGFASKKNSDVRLS